MSDLFENERITFREKERCAERELSWRRRVYPRRIIEGKMTREEADRQIEVMSAILDDYRKAAALEADTARTQPQKIKRFR